MDGSQMLVKALRQGAVTIWLKYVSDLKSTISLFFLHNQILKTFMNLESIFST